jgi:FkbM family methyltransferase
MRLPSTPAARPKVATVSIEPTHGCAFTTKLIDLGQIAHSNRSELEGFCRAQSQPLYLGRNTAICRILGRYKLYVDTRDRGFGSHVLLDGCWEMWLTQFMARVVKPAMIVADVGANFGYYTLLLADLVGSNGHVYSVEPNPRCAALLRHSVELNGFAGRTSVVQAAASDTDGAHALLFVPDGEPKNATIVADEAQVSGAEGATVAVASRSLDSILGPDGKLDFIKIDAEGAEERIFQGMLQTVQRSRPSIVLEFNAARYRDPPAFLSQLRKFYPGVCYVDYAGEAVPISPDQVLSERFGEDWLLFLSR